MSEKTNFKATKEILDNVEAFRLEMEIAHSKYYTLRSKIVLGGKKFGNIIPATSGLSLEQVAGTLALGIIQRVQKEGVYPDSFEFTIFAKRADPPTKVGGKVREKTD